MTRTLSPPLPPIETQHFVFEDASWQFYEDMLREIGNRPIRVTYDEGRMEIMSPLPEHEGEKRIIGRMIETLSMELNILMVSYGSTTFRKKGEKEGLGAGRMLLLSQ